MEGCVKVKKTIYSLYIKRVLDIFLSGVAILLLSPLFGILYVMELAFHGKPALYKTNRPGKDGKLFSLYKFRSMTNERDESGKLLPEDKRLTFFGLLLRKTSADELPELVNILKGDMSIIGPRPLLVEYLPLYSKRHSYRHAVRPGLACVRIVPSDSNTWTWREQFENDIYYVENVSFITDIKMLIAVIKEALRGSDYRANDTRVPFNEYTLDETRSRQEVYETLQSDKK